jgi:hypothetical protein
MKTYNAIINEIVENKSNPFQQLICNYIREILQLNFTNVNISLNQQIGFTQFILNVKNGKIILEIDNEIPNVMLIYAKITNTKILAMNNLSANMEIYSQELPFTWEVLNEDGWITVIEKANQAIIKQAKLAGIK